MRILFTNLVSFWKMHFAEELDLMLRHIENGDEVFILQCNEALEHGCGVDLDKNKLRCTLCRSEFNTAINMLNIKTKITIIPIDFSKCTTSPTEDYKVENIEDLKKIVIDGFDIGSSVASMIISGVRNPKPELDKFLKKLAAEHINNVVKLKDFLNSVITMRKIEKIYVFNGRLPYYRVALRIGQSKKIDTYLHERGYELNKYSVTVNTYIHDLEYIKKELEKKWEQEPNYKLKQATAVDWYDRYISGKNKAILHFVKRQDEKIELNIDRAKVNIGIFISSEDEMETIEEWKNVLYENQNYAIQGILDYDNWNDNIHFYLRIHPNLKDIKNLQTNFLNSITSERITVISAESPISTYKLLNEVDVILTYGSTVGIEACYRKKPMILAGRALYENLEGFCKPHNHQELCDLINSYPKGSFDLEKAYVSAIKYAWFLNNFGQKFKYFEQTDYNEIKYLGKSNFWSFKYHFAQKLINLRQKIVKWRNK